MKDEKERLISWSSLPDASIKNTGKVVFRPSRKGTEIIVTIPYHAALGIAGKMPQNFLIRILRNW